jgi:hypothetical protein
MALPWTIAPGSTRDFRRAGPPAYLAGAMTALSRRLVASLLLLVLSGGLGLPLLDAIAFHRQRTDVEAPGVGRSLGPGAHAKTCVITAALGTRTLAVSRGTPILHLAPVDRSPALLVAAPACTGLTRGLPPVRAPPAFSA